MPPRDHNTCTHTILVFRGVPRWSGATGSQDLALVRQGSSLQAQIGIRGPIERPFFVQAHDTSDDRPVSPSALRMAPEI